MRTERSVRSVVDVGDQRAPQVVVVWEAHVFRHDADDRGRDLVDLDHVSDDVRVRVVAVLPDVVADQHDRRRIRLSVGVGEVTPEVRPLPQHPEHVRRDHRRLDAFGGSLCLADVGREPAEGRKLGEGFRPRAPLLVFGPRCRELRLRLRVAQVHVKQLMRVLERQAADQHGVDESEHCRVHADAEREGQNRDGGEARVLYEESGGKSEVLQQSHGCVYEDHRGCVPAIAFLHHAPGDRYIRGNEPRDPLCCVRDRTPSFCRDRGGGGVRPPRGGADENDERSIESLRKAFATELRRRVSALAPPDAAETTPGVSARRRFESAIEELVRDCDGFLRRAAHPRLADGGRAPRDPARHDADARDRQPAQGVLHRRRGPVRGTPFQGKGFRSLGQEAIYAARHPAAPRRGVRGHDDGWRGDVVAPADPRPRRRAGDEAGRPRPCGWCSRRRWRRPGRR